VNTALHSQLLDDVEAGSLPTARRARGDAFAANEDACIEDPVGTSLEAWASHTFAANGFGDAVIGAADRVPARTAADLEREAREARSWAVGNVLASCLSSLAASLRRARERYRAYRIARETRDALSSLDDRTLHDLGYHRSEIESVATEVAMRRAQWSS
jgi:uncharacterized protein YjiS (DUF1127 family)